MSNMHTARMHMTEAAIAEVQAQMIEAWKAENLASLHHGFTTDAFIAFRDEAEHLLQNA